MGNAKRKARKQAGEKYQPKPAKTPTGHYRTTQERRLAQRSFRSSIDEMIRKAAAKLREEDGL